MRRKHTFLLLCAIIALAAAGYTSARFVREAGDKTIGVRRGSVSETQSRDDGFYIGRYAPAKRLLALNTPSTLTVPDAWVEHAWKRELSLTLRERKRAVDGYYVYIPIPADESPNGRKPIWDFGYTFELQQGDAEHPSYRGTGFDSGLGFMIFVDTLPDTLTFAVKQKQSGPNDTITNTIEFKRVF